MPGPVTHRPRPALSGLAVGLSLLLAACGGSGGGSSPRPTSTATPAETPGTPAATRTPAPTRTPGGSSIFPPIVNTGRVVFASSNGETCCVAVDPGLLAPNPATGQAVLVLDDLPIGPATVTVAGYTEDFAPAPPATTSTCKTVNTTGTKPCDPTRRASAAYESDPLQVTIFGGVRVNLGSIDVTALPFLLTFAPPQDAVVPLPVAMGFTVVDAATGIDEESVALEITLDVPQGEPPVFRPLTKRVPVALDPCEDGSGAPCSDDTNSNLAGFKARAVAEYLEYLPAGPVEARITAQNNADPPRDLDFRYLFVVAPDPAATPTPDAVAAIVAEQERGGVWMLPTATPTVTPVVE